jgi:outer membrane protein assembly factor BamB
MERKIVVVTMLTLLLASVLTVALTVQPVSVRAGLREESVQAKSVDWWPMFHHDLTHSGYSTSTAPTTNLTGADYRTGSWVASSPTVVDGVVYVGCGDNNVYALNATTGTKVWNYTTDNWVQWSSPAVVDGVVYVGSTDNNVYALNATTGTKVWKYATSGAIFSSPAVAGGVVYVGSEDNNVYALNATTGTKVWKYATTGPIWSSPAVVDGVVYVGSWDGKVYALSATTGKFVWKHTTGWPVVSSPAVVDGRVYVGSDDNKTYCLNASTGAHIWNYTTGGAVESSPAVVDGRVYVGSDDNKTYCLNASTGAHIWNYATGGAVESSPAVASGMVFVGSWDGKVYALNATTGTLVWNYNTYYTVFSSPAVAGGAVYVSSLNGNIYAIGADRWQVDVYWSYRAEPAPMGIADYGIGPSGPYEYATKSFVGIVTVASLLTTDRSADHLVSFQLNVEFEFNTTCGLRVFWMQNVADVRTFGSVLCLENFVVNVWNWSDPSAIIDPSGISGKGQFGKPQDPYGYVCTRDGIFTPFNRTTPITITLNVTSGVSFSGEPTVSFAYDFGDGSVTYDMVTFTNVTVTSVPGFKVSGFNYAPEGGFYESALIMGGIFEDATDVLSDVQLQLEYWNGHNYQIVPNAYNFGSNTAEKIDNVLSGFSHYSGNGKIFAEILPGAGQLGQLYNQFQTGAIDITSPLTLGTLYVTNASDPNATAWQIPFVSGAVNVTLYPGYYSLQLYNQAGKLFDERNCTVSAGQTSQIALTFVTDLNKDGKVNIQDITIVAVAYGSKPGDPKWNAIADLDKNGWINIIDMTMVAKDYGKAV